MIKRNNSEIIKGNSVNVWITLTFVLLSESGILQLGNLIFNQK